MIYLCLKKRFVGLLRKSITLLFVLSLVVSIGVCSASALEAGQQQYLLQDGVEYTLFCLGPGINQEMTTTTVWTSSFHNRIDYTTFFASPGGGYFYRLKVGVKSGSLFTIAPGQTVKVSTLVTDFESDTFENMQFELVYSVNGQSKTITKVFSGTVLETEAFFVINNDSSSDYQILSFAMYYKTSDGYPDPAYAGSNFGFRNPTVYMYDQSDKILAGFGNIFGESYDQPDGSAQEDYENAESQLVGGVTSDLAGFENNWNDIGGFLGEYQGAFYGLGEFIGKLTSIPIIKIILLFSISIGVFGLLLGISSVVTKIDVSGNHYDGWDSKWLM